MIIKSSAGTEHVRAEYNITRDINGIPTLETGYFNPVHHHVDPIEIHIKDSEDVYIVVINENDAVIDSNRVKLTGVHSLIYDFTGSRIYDEITQHFSIEQILGVVFNDTNYTFEVAGDRRYYALQFQNFGGARTRLELLNQICNRWDCEWDVVGNMVYIKDKVGADGSENKKFRYLMNIHDSKVEFDITEGATFIKGEFGKKPEEDEEDVEDTYFELEYRHELANQYGIRHAEPYSNENITTIETAEQYLKERLENTWRLSIDIDVVELESSTNEEYFLGDTVWAIDERVNLDMQTRIIKIVKTYNVDDQLLSTNVTLGNKSFVDFVLGTAAGASEFVTLEELERESLTLEEELARKIAEFDDAFNLARDQMRAEYTQAYADAHAEIAAIDERMSTEIANEIAEFESAFNSEVQAAKDLAAQQIADTEQRITTTIDTTRNEMEQDFNLAVSDAREYAEQQAAQHANAVDTKLETMRGVHADLIEENRDNIADVNDFIGDRTDNLSGILQTLEHDFNQKIASETWHYNLLRGTQFDEDFWVVNGSTGGAIFDDEPINYWYYNANSDTANTPYIQSTQEIELKTGVKYRLSFDVQTFGMKLFDHVFFIANDGTNNFSLTTAAMSAGNILNVPLGATWRRIWLEFTSVRDFDVTGFIRIGTSIDNNPFGRSSFKIRRPYLTESENIQWLYHLDDNMQNLEEITMRVNELETGFETVITRTEYDNKTDQIEGTVRSIEDTVDGVKDTIQNHENWITTNGSSIERTVDGFDSKVWLNDLHNPNMIPYSDVSHANNRSNWSTTPSSSYLAPGGGSYGRIRIGNPSISYLAAYTPRFSVVSGETYTISFESAESPSVYNTTGNMNYTYLIYPNISNVYISNAILNTRVHIGTYAGMPVYRYTHTFVAGETTDNFRVLIGSRIIELGVDTSIYFRYPKLELGNRATPYYTAFSGLTQRVDEISLLVQDIDGSGLVRQSDITVSPSSVRIGSTEILGDDVLASVLNVSPSAIDMITQKMRLSGDLYVDGDITSLAISAVEGNFASLLASNIDSVNINAGNITTGTLNAYRLAVNSVLVNRLFGYSVFANEVTAKAVDAIEGNFARLFASEIETVDLNASNISTGTMSSARLQVNNALINRLISNSILTSEMRAQSLTAVRGDIADLRTRILTSDVITSEHISSSNALIDKMFASSALISRLTSKSAFISQIQTIDLAAEQVRVGFNGISSNVTINSSGVTITNGALTVNRTDGGAPTIIGGHNPNGVSLYPSTPNRRDSVYNIEGQYATRSSGTGSYAIYDFYMFEHFYTDLMLDFVIINMSSSPINVQVRVRGTDGSSFSWHVIYEDIPAGTAIFPRTIRNIGIPNGTQERFFIETRTLTNHGKFGIHTYMVKHLDNGHGYPRLEHDGRV